MKLRNKKLLFWLCVAIAGVGVASFIWCIWLTGVMEPFKITMSSVVLLIYVATTAFFYTLLTELWGD